MSTQYRFREKYRIQLREKDPLPPHVHLTGGGIDVLIGLRSVVAIRGHAPAVVLPEALDWIRAHQQQLMEEWTLWHP
ncbi:DUF4160 domain-containing protein [Pseudomonas sp. CCI3.2]|uniref:DUF4160 domain-containing protein n=1 Tax=unclassified Pseudomonas TaxID=196821 RepID=UPI002AC8C532|nr:MULTISPECIES: DUF4160 domain-containing protein [unclassified Pseudomonas]MEB0078164.1 DUF4160 domain-containing protein [Pseudomonas sp. MH10out]MEB0093442.1 DUF4160 domain-containing protein [Pseudomonas sp. CCI4.2]MEB0102218.1 DUF4160 domain-containing protein [Pseudomonas sp. CCI3.2]MEB0132299.1 DUF4160 domain-containing protein [Pseudomonas sp. CCI2.4]MEB0158943.1 DUF4160 domain-containing protein [Pseudomonas sp. AH2 (2023)]